MTGEDINGESWNKSKKWIEKSIEKADDRMEKLENKWGVDLNRLDDKLKHRLEILDQKLEESHIRTDDKIDKLGEAITTRLGSIEVAAAEANAVTKERARVWGMQGGTVPAGIAILVYLVSMVVKMFVE